MCEVIQMSIGATITTVAVGCFLLIAVALCQYVYDYWHEFKGWAIAVFVILMIWVFWIAVIGTAKLSNTPVKAEVENVST